MKRIFDRILFILFLTIAPFHLMSQVKISIKVENLDDNVLYLLKYKSDKTHIVIDTSSFSSEYMTFTNNINYDEGIYIISDSKLNPLFEILIGKDQKFSIHVEELMDFNSYKVKGCKETAEYFDIYSKIIYNKLYIKALESEMEYFPDNTRKIDSLKLKHNEYLESIKIKDSHSFLKTYIDFNKEIIVPQEYKDKSEQYIIDHYFDDISFRDVRILNTRLLKNKLDDYFNNYMSKQNTDVVLQKIDYIIYRTTSGYRDIPKDLLNHEVRDYILWYLYSKYFSPERVEDELVYIQLVDNYFSKEKIENLTENIRKEIIKRASILRDITIGKAAPHFSFTDDYGDNISLDNINSKFTVLFFYKPDCNKCIRDRRILRIFKESRDDITVLEINISEENFDNVSHDIIEKYDIMTTPTIYLLNENKEIIAKHIKSEEVEFYINKR